MQVLLARNVHTALPVGFCHLKEHGVWVDTRNGAALTSAMPVTTVYQQPLERVLFYPERDANPFLHFYESLWMLAGRDDVAALTHYTSTMKNFSDDGVTFHGAYGKRWRSWFGYDQIESCITLLRQNPRDRRVVLGMWDPSQDLLVGAGGGKDVPCNMTIHFRVNPSTDSLDMTVFCRSNDMVWGAYGANAVHMSYLLEYVAACSNLRVGVYRQVSDDFHCYKNHFDKLHTLSAMNDGSQWSPYSERGGVRYPLMSIPRQQWDMELRILVNEKEHLALTDPFFTRVAVPIIKAHDHYKAHKKHEEGYTGALEIISQCENWDWRLACEEWIQRRRNAWLRSKDDGVNYE